MKMFKRFAAALLAGVMVLAMLTACGGGAGGNSSNEIESKVLKYLNTVNGTSYSNNADLQSKVRAVLAKTDDTGVIKAEEFRMCRMMKAERPNTCSVFLTSM